VPEPGLAIGDNPHMTAAPNSAAQRADALIAQGDEAAAIALLRAGRAELECARRLRERAVAEREGAWLEEALATPGTAEDAAIAAALRALAAQQPAQALRTIDLAVAAQVDGAALRHHRGRVLHNLGQREAALASLRQALSLAPDYAEAWYSLAHVLRANGQLEDAVHAYQRALQRSPGFRAALLNLGITLLALEQGVVALATFERLLARYPDLDEGWINRGLCLHLLGRGEEAADCYRAILARNPRHALAHYYLGTLLNEQLHSEAARLHLETALQLAPDDADAAAELVGLLEQTNQIAAAEQRLAQARRSAPQHPGLAMEAARLARRGGRLDEAAGLLQGIDVRRLPPRTAQLYWFERGQLHDRRGEAAAAIQAFDAGNALAAQSPRRRGIDPAAFPRRCAALRDWLRSAGDPAADAPAMAPLPFRLVFLVGMPRSGTTLLDTMLDAHPEVASIEEKPTLERLLPQLPGGAHYLPYLATLDVATRDGLRARYREALAPYLAPGFQGLVLDKLPLRLLHLPLIRALFPEARLLFALRHPCDVVLSNYMQQYVPNEAFIHFDTLAASAATYDRVMQAWTAMLERWSLAPQVVRYEALVADPEAVLRDTCGYLGLDLHPAMLDTRQRLAGRGRIQTNSYQQVAEAVYQRAAGRWQAYRPWFTPLLPLLAPHVERFGYSTAAA
jgi:tetratricopeptide (TPR) repeat protein